MFDSQIMTSHGGRQASCRHLAEGVCATPSGVNAKRACMRDVEAGMQPTERLVMDRDQVWIFPDAVSAVTAQRANYSAAPKHPYLASAIARARG